MQPKYHIQLLDSYAKATCSEFFKKYSTLYEEYTTAKQKLEEYAETHEMKIVEWYMDEGISGRKLIPFYDPIPYDAIGFTEIQKL